MSSTAEKLSYLEETMAQLAYSQSKEMLRFKDVVAPNIPRIAQTYFGCEDLDYFAVRVRKKSLKQDRQKRES